MSVLSNLLTYCISTGTTNAPLEEPTCNRRDKRQGLGSAAEASCTGQVYFTLGKMQATRADVSEQCPPTLRPKLLSRMVGDSIVLQATSYKL